MDETFKDTLPSELVKHITAICGAKGVHWFDELPRTIRRLEEKWEVTVGEPFPGIEFNYVAEAVRSGGENVVVKISPPYERIEIFQEAKYLRLREGEGAIKVFEVDREAKAILLERAHPGEAMFHHFEADPAGCIGPVIKVLESVLRPPPRDMSDVELLDNWFARFQRYKDTTFPGDAAAKATAIYGRLSKQPVRTYYLHGDFHPGNIVTSHRSRFLAIDPKGIVGHIGYDIAVFLNNLHWWQKGKDDVLETLQFAIDQFSSAFGIKESEIREWAFAYMVIGAWWNFDDMPEHYDSEVAMFDIWGV